MRIHHLGHSCLLIETDRVRVVIDPGAFSDGLADLRELDQVLVTHQHLDHLDPQRVPAMLAANSGAVLRVEPDTLASTEPLGLAAEAVPAGSQWQIGDLTISAVGGRHALIHERIPRVGNVGLLVREQDGACLFHPGDSLEYLPNGVDVLALPLAAPWSKFAETADFAAQAGAAGASAMVPIHDAILAPAGRGVFLKNLSTLVPQLPVHDLATGGPQTF